MWQHFIKNRFVQFLASLKLAVCIIIALILLMTWGTLTESIYNTQFAQWRVYHSFLFVSVEILLFTNILFAALVRFPYKKRLSGFYIIHLGLLTIMIGATLTAIKGIDGTLRLLPDKATNAVVINEPYLYAFYDAPNAIDPVEFHEPLPQQVSPYSNPQKPFMQVLDYDIYVEEFLPFASPNYSWKAFDDPNKKSRNLSLTLKNAMAAQSVDLSTANYEDQSKKMGPLSLGLLNHVSHDCFESALKSGKKFLFQNPKHCIAFDEPSKNLKIESVSIDKLKDDPFLKLEIKTPENENYTFFPQLSAHPVQNDVQIDEDSEGYLLKMEPFTQAPNILFFKDDYVGYGKSDWSFDPMELNKEVKLPWMGFVMTLTKWIDNKYQSADWYYDPPKSGDTSKHYAVKIKLKHRFQADDEQSFWVDDTELKKIKTKTGFALEFLCGKKLYYLPFRVSLDHFKMNTNPGTMDPASYESFVTVTEQNGQTSKEHIFMNNPLKRDPFTLYQASYFQIDQKSFGSVLSVNHDPGRILKYVGSILLIFGTILHFVLRSKKS